MKSLVPDYIQSYINSVTDKQNDIQKLLQKETEELIGFPMQTPHDQAVFLSFMIKLINAKNVIEVGVFTGYSALSMAVALPSDGRLIACDNNIPWTQMAQKYWEKADVRHKIDLRIGQAVDTLNSIISDGQINAFDMAYIDADKNNYENYYEACLQLIRPGGLLCIDNMLWGGRVAKEDPVENIAQADAYTQSLRDLARFIYNDKRVDASLVPIGDGLLLVRKI